jgi:hypothetical protein
MAFWSMVAVRRAVKISDELKEHYRRLWGEPSRTASFRMRGHAIDVFKWEAQKNPEQVNMYATIGTSAHGLPGQPSSHRVEFYAGLDPARDEIARPLALLALEPVINGMSLGHGQSVTYPDPLWKGTDMRSFLLLRPSELVIPDLQLPGLHVEFLQAVPLYSVELDYKARHRVEGLLRRWEASGVRFWNPDRVPAPDS